MAIVRVQHSFQGVSGKAEDQFVNVWYFLTDDPEGDLPGLSTAVKGFYSRVPSQSGSSTVWSRMSSVIDAPGARVKIYDMADPLPRPAIYDEIYTPATNSAGAQNLPSEVAVCLSYTAGAQAGTPIARRRGRIYIGPLNATALGAPASNVDSRPDTFLRLDMLSSAADTQSIALALGYTWCVYSPTLGGANPIVTGWVDDAWDTQRRRGIDSTSRVTLTF